tara:strand:- start:10652 stop:10909 length:258 start_codon:yes stop_codon:yes gene_type:complete
MAFDQLSINSKTCDRLRQLRHHWSTTLYSNEEGLSLGTAIAILMDIHAEMCDVPVDLVVLKRLAKKYPRKGRPRNPDKPRVAFGA